MASIVKKMLFFSGVQVLAVDVGDVLKLNASLPAIKFNGDEINFSDLNGIEIVAKELLTEEQVKEKIGEPKLDSWIPAEHALRVSNKNWWFVDMVDTNHVLDAAQWWTRRINREFEDKVLFMAVRNADDDYQLMVPEGAIDTISRVGQQ